MAPVRARTAGLLALLAVLKAAPLTAGPVQIAANGAARIVRSRAAVRHHAEEPGRWANGSAAAVVAAVAARGPQLLLASDAAPPDEKDASMYCGSPRYVATCGFPFTEPICVQTTSGQQACYRGVCVCGQPGGCTEPTCSEGACPQGRAPCADGRCVAAPGAGWECWHPCNAAHGPADYGTVMAPTVDYIRTQTQACNAYLGGVSDGSLPYEPPLDAGLKLSSQASIFGGKQATTTTTPGPYAAKSGALSAASFWPWPLLAAAAYSARL